MTIKAIKDGELKIFIDKPDLSNTTMTYNYFIKKIIKNEDELDIGRGKLPQLNRRSELRKGLADRWFLLIKMVFC